MAFRCYLLRREGEEGLVSLQRRRFTSSYTNQLLYMQNIRRHTVWEHRRVRPGAGAACVHACVARLCDTNFQRVPLFSSSDINIWANAVRQLLVENPQQSLAVTTWECSSEGHALHCDYKQHRESRRALMPRSSFLACVSDVFLLCCKYSVIVVLFFLPCCCLSRAICERLQAVASTGIWSHILIIIAKTVAVLCHSHSVIAVDTSEGGRYRKDLMEAVKP